jgi:hypothetical protein
MEAQADKCIHCGKEATGSVNINGFTYHHCNDCLFAMLSYGKAKYNPNSYFEKMPEVREQPDTDKTHRMIREVCLELADFLKEKNIAYGNSAIAPIRIFSKTDPADQINVRIDDKLNRLFQGKQYPGDNDLWDLAGYVILKYVEQRINGKKEPEQNPQKQN